MAEAQSQQKFWAKRKNKTLGPFATLEEARAAGHTLFPKKLVLRDAFITGYGTYGPSFDIRFVDRVNK